VFNIYAQLNGTKKNILRNFDSNMTTSCLAAAILDLSLPVTSDTIDSIDDMSS